MAIMQGDTWATMHFTYRQNGQDLTAVVVLNAHRTGDAHDDLTFTVGQILAEAIQSKAGYELTTADLLSETVTRVYPPQQ